jgi:hypothetical protein
MVEWARQHPEESSPVPGGSAAVGPDPVDLDRIAGAADPDPSRPDTRPASARTGGSVTLDLDRVGPADPVAARKFLDRVAYTNSHSSSPADGPLTASERAWDLLVGAALLVLAIVLPLLRQSGTASWNTVWAEDGSVYAQQAIRQGGLNVLFRGYAGYVQLPPRLLAVPTAWMSVRELALYASLAGVVVSALLAWFVYRMARGWISSPLVRLVLASFIVLAPSLAVENTANMVNTIWVFLAAAPWALVALEERRRDTVVRAGVAFLAAAATPLCFLYLPIAVAWVLIRRTRSALVVAGAFATGLLVQGVGILTTSDVSRLEIRDVQVLRDGVGQRVFATFLLGPRWASWLWLQNWRLSALGSTVVVLACIGALLPRSGRRAQLAGVAFVAYAVMLFVVPVWGRGTFVLGLVEGGSSADGSARFDVVPVILLASAVAVLLGPVGGRPPRWVRQIAIPVFVAQVALLTAVNFSVVNLRSHDLSWKPKVAAIYLSKCQGRPSDRLVTIPNNRQLAAMRLGLFPVTVPCKSLAP